MILFFCAGATKNTLFFVVHKNKGGKRQILSPGPGIKRPVKRVKRPHLAANAEFAAVLGSIPSSTVESD